MRFRGGARFARTTPGQKTAPAVSTELHHLIHHQTLLIGYDETRGEPRHKGVAEGGDCVDCFRCVEVCPTGIDIRAGLQMECIACANCIDACDTVMEKIGKPTGLVRYDSILMQGGTALTLAAGGPTRSHAASRCTALASPHASTSTDPSGRFLA